MLSRKFDFFCIIRRRIVYTQYRQKNLSISNIDNLYIPNIDINALSLTHVDKLFIPHVYKWFLSI